MSLLVHMMYISVLNVVCTFSVINERERERERDKGVGVIHTLVLNNKTGYSLLSINSWPIKAIVTIVFSRLKNTP